MRVVQVVVSGRADHSFRGVLPNSCV